MVVLVFEQLRSAFYAKSHGAVELVSHAGVKQVCPYYDSCATLAGVTVNENLVSELGTSVNDDLVHHLNYSYCCLVFGYRKVFPIGIVELDFVLHEQLGCITKTNFRDDAVAAIRVFAWFLQIEYSFNSFLLKLSHDVEILDKSITKSL